MASSIAPVIEIRKAGAAITKGTAVKKGADDNHVVECTANTDLAVGIAQNEVLAAEDLVEVLVDGGGKMLLGENVVYGNHLVPHTDGTGVKPNAAGDKLVAKAMEDGSSGEIVGVVVVHGHAGAAE